MRSAVSASSGTPSASDTVSACGVRHSGGHGRTDPRVERRRDDQVLGQVVAHQRGYRSETAIWVGGMAMGVATGYLRIAADKHWLSDVLVGTVIGLGSGLAIPLVFHGDAIRGTAPVTRPAGEPRFLSFGGAF